MSLEKIKNNSELVNAYNNYKICHKEYINFFVIQKQELKNLIDKLKGCIDILISNPNYATTAIAEEKQKILMVQKEIENRLLIE